MANRLNPRYLHLNLIIQLLSILSPSSALFFPPDNHLISCGAISPIALHDHRIFLPDASYLISDNPKISISADATAPLQSNSHAFLYQSARVFTSVSSYKFHISNRGTHIIRLHFYPFSTSSHNLASAQFHVLASGFVLLSNFTASSDSPIKEFILRVDCENLEIFFVPLDSSSFAFVNAIEVISAPADLVEDKARLVQADQVLSSDGLSKQAMETLFRINVGGPKVTPFNDTFWRTWVPDTEHFDSDSVTKLVSFSGRIKHQRYGASREVAPDSVYNTARTIDGNSSEVSSRLAWKFPVVHGYKYRIRMHFCDIASLALNELYFNVYINGYLAYEDFDISSATGQVLASPYYLDFVSDVGSSGLLLVSIGPSSRFVGHSRVDGLLNGLEIMKLNNTAGSLDGELSFALLLHTSGGGFSAAVRLLICWSAFVMLSFFGLMLIWRWRAESKSHIAWSPLPMDASDVKMAKEGHEKNAYADKGFC